jgi:hypothetical protein
VNKVLQGVLQTVLAAVLLAILAKVWQTYEQVLELRHDVDNLYSEVNDHLQEH